MTRPSSTRPIAGLPLAAAWLLLPALTAAAGPQLPAERPDDEETKIEVRVRGAGPRVVERFVVVEGEESGDDSVFLRRLAPGEGPWFEVLGGEDEEGGIAVRRFLMQRGYLGVRLLDVTSELRRHWGGPEDAGVLISQVEPDSPAAAAGLEVGDLVVAVDGEPVATAAEVVREVGGRDGGEVVTLELVRNGRRETATATLIDRERPQLDVAPLVFGAPGGFEKLPLMLSIDPSRVDEAIGEWRERMESPEWRSRYRRQQSELQKRIEDLEGRLRDLERELERLPEPPP